MLAILYALYALALLLALASFRGDGARARYFAERTSRRSTFTPPATVIVPVKGADEGLAQNLAALAAQDYPDYELLVAVREPADITPEALPASARLIVAGDAFDTPGASHKIGNLLAAVAAARPESALYAFADSDGRPGPQWLRALAAALDHPEVGAATGYRWYIATPNFGSRLRAAWNAAIAGRLGPGNAPFCWGGAMAITRDHFHRLGIRGRWRGQVSDDYQMARAVRAAGLRIAFAPGAVVPSLDHISHAEFLRWARRQMILTRVYAPGLWWQALIAHIVYVSGLAAGAALGWPVLVLIALSIAKAWPRARLFDALHPGLPSQVLPQAFYVTLATVYWLGILLASAGTRTIMWRGVRYHLSPPS